MVSASQSDSEEMIVHQEIAQEILQELVFLS
jgi:hypothetical protein